MPAKDGVLGDKKMKSETAQMQLMKHACRFYCSQSVDLNFSSSLSLSERKRVHS